MTKKPINPQFIFRSDPETVALVTAAAARRRTKVTQWLRDAVALAIELENGARHT
jgi:hypothetical protein